jgi:hypothetical protein
VNDTLPLRFALSVGDPSFALGVPNGPVAGLGGVTTTGSEPATLRIPAHDFMAAASFHGIAQVQITTHGVVDGPFEATTPPSSPGA